MNLIFFFNNFRLLYFLTLKNSTKTQTISVKLKLKYFKNYTSLNLFCSWTFDFILQ